MSDSVIENTNKNSLVKRIAKKIFLFLLLQVILFGVCVAMVFQVEGSIPVLKQDITKKLEFYSNFSSITDLDTLETMLTEYKLNYVVKGDTLSLSKYSIKFDVKDNKVNLKPTKELKYALDLVNRKETDVIYYVTFNEKDGTKSTTAYYKYIFLKDNNVYSMKGFRGLCILIDLLFIGFFVIIPLVKCVRGLTGKALNSISKNKSK